MTTDSRGRACISILACRGPAPGGAHRPRGAARIPRISGGLAPPDSLADLQPDDRLLQCDLRAPEIGVRRALAQALQGAVPGPGRPLAVDPLGPLGYLGQDAHALRQDLGEPPGDGDVAPGA